MCSVWCVVCGVRLACGRLGSGQWAVGGGKWVVGSGPWVVGSRQ